MSSHSISLSIGLSIGLHVIAISGASFLLPNADSSLHGPLEVVLVELSKPVHNSGDPIPSVAAVKSEVPIMQPPSRPRDTTEEENAALPEMSRVEPATANDTIPYQEQRYDAMDVSAAVQEPATDVPSSSLDEKSGIMRPDVQYLSSTPPRYPRLARKRGWEGTVLLEVEILSSGNVGTIRVARSSGHRVLDRAAQKAVEKWRFSVNRADGLGVTATVEIPVTFELDSQGERNRG